MDTIELKFNLTSELLKKLKKS